MAFLKNCFILSIFYTGSLAAISGYHPSPLIGPGPNVHYAPVAVPGYGTAPHAPAPVHAAPAAAYSEDEIDYYAHPSYSFNYGVSDGLTGDSKSQSETRDGDVVKGSYSVAEPDGSVRVVHYTSDDVHGFNAVVKRIGGGYHTKAVSPVVAASPPIIAAPVAPAAGVPHGRLSFVPSTVYNGGYAGHGLLTGSYKQEQHY